MRLSGAYLLDELRQKRQIEKWEGISGLDGYLRPFLLENEENYPEGRIWVTSGKKIKENYEASKNESHYSLPHRMLLVISGWDEEVEEILHGVFWNKAYIGISNDARETEVLNDIQRIFDRCEEWKSKLEELTMKSASVEELLKVSLNIMNNPLMVMGMDFTLVAEVGMEGIPQHLRLYSDAGVNMEQMNALLQNDDFQKMKTEKEPVIFPPYIAGYRSMNLNLYPQEKNTYRMVLVENNREITEGDACLMKILAYYVEVLLNKESLASLKDDLDNIFWTLLSDRTADYMRISKRLSDLGWNSRQEYLCLVLQIGSAQQKNLTSNAVCKYIKREFSDASSFRYGEKVVSFFNLTKMGLDEDEVEHRLAPFIRDSFLMAGYSRVMAGHMYLRRQYEQAQIALEIGSRKKSYLWIHRFNQVALPYILEEATRKLPAHMICYENLLKLREIDENQHTDYMLTLKTYLEQNLNATQTANNLFIHRSTFLYRLDKIKEILDSALDDPDEIFYLNLSFRLLGEQESEQ